MVFADAGAGIHCPDQDELGWEGDRALGAGDRDGAVFQRLAQEFQVESAELGHF
jgi:hypothetical protein